jgi:phosphatidylserine decarboxylase
LLRPAKDAIRRHLGTIARTLPLALISTVLKPVHPEGYRFITLFAVAAGLLFLLWEPAGWLGVGLTVW